MKWERKWIGQLRRRVLGPERPQGAEVSEEQAGTRSHAARPVVRAEGSGQPTVKVGEPAPLPKVRGRLPASVNGSETPGPAAEQGAGSASSRRQRWGLVLTLGAALAALATSAAVAAGRLSPTGRQDPTHTPPVLGAFIAASTPLAPTAITVPTDNVPHSTPSLVPATNVALAPPSPEADTSSGGPISIGTVWAPGFTGAYLRTDPSLSARIIRTLPTGTTVEMLQGSATANGFGWVHVRTAQEEVGWIVAGVITSP